MDFFEKYFNSALRFLSFRPRSEKEVRDYLKVKSQKSKVKIEAKITDSIIEKLKEQKFIDDLEFAKWWIEQRTTHKPKGLRLIQLELKQKGIDKDTVEKAISDLGFKINDEIANAKKSVEKVYKRYERLPKDEAYRKLGQFLARRGFSFETIKKALTTLGLHERG